MTEENSSFSMCLDGDRRLKITPFMQRQYIENRTKGYRLRVEASHGCRMPDAVFRYYKHPANSTTGVEYAEFTGVCSWPDLEEYPEGGPALNDVPDTFRLNYVDIVLATNHIAYECWELIQEELEQLKESMDMGDDLVEGEPVWIGNPPPEE